MTREWCMPDSNTFSIKPIKNLMLRYLKGVSIDPFANTQKLATYTNDLNPEYGTTHNMDALDFLKSFENDSIDTILFDPPFSQRQVAEVYKKFNISVNMETTQTSYWTYLKTEIARILKPGGIVISCGWNSNGVGKKNDFEMIEVLLVSHGSMHNDTIVTVERKVLSIPNCFQKL
jgi:hypothetical protein